jgi:VWFA-related protein
VGLRRFAVAAIVVGLATPLAGHYVLGPAEAGHYVQQDQPPTFRTEANYVRVDAYPTSGGVPVPDLRPEDFEVLEDGAPQKIDAFERVVIRGVPQDQRGREPGTVAESRAMLENPRARVFVLFLDVYHVSADGSANIRGALTRALDRLIGPDDLFAVMTPEMSALDLSFSRKTATVAGILNRHWTWGERFQLVQPDREDSQYLQCYPGFETLPACQSDRGVAEEMIERRHEKRTIDALQDLVRHLRGVREERKAVLVLSEGWRLYTPNPALAAVLNCQVPGNQNPGVDPRNGRLTARPPGDQATGNLYACDRDRMNLAQIDNDRLFREILDDANRANTSFYPIDPRGLPVFDEPIVVPDRSGIGRGMRSGAPPTIDRARLNARLESLRTLAVATDGLAVLNSNDLDGGLKRVTDDLSSYYLLGYYSSGRLDGKFHSITVRVKRPGVQVRARRGYRAPTAAEVAAGANRTAPAAPANAAAAAEARAVDSALSTLTSAAREAPLRLHAAAGWSNRSSAMTVVGEIGATEEWKPGADADVMLTNAAGDTLTTERAAVPPGARGFRVMLAPPQPLEPGEYTIRVRARSRRPGAAPANETLRVTLPPSPSSSGAVFVRRGPGSGSQEAPTADLRFRRTEQVRVERLDDGDRIVSARVLDRTGKPTAVLVTTAVRDDAGVRWQTAQVNLSPLAAGDYLIEIVNESVGSGGWGGSAGSGRSGRSGGSGGSDTTRTLLAFRVVQ